MINLIITIYKMIFKDFSLYRAGEACKLII